MIRIYKSEERRILENNGLRIISLTKDRNFFPLRSIDDVAINDLEVYPKKIDSDGYLVIIPLLNNICLKWNGIVWNLEANQLFVNYLKKEDQLEIVGAHETDFSYFLTFFLELDYLPIRKSIIPIDLDKNNKLHTIIRHDLFNLYLGKFDLRKERDFPYKKKDRKWLAMSITGAFEVYNRLLESRDSLLIETSEIVDFESLSDQSLMLLLEY